ncbi:MAG: serine hydrolase domain-containing protein, partial [Thermoanaerobaculia bacterium]|nr:serine hydrolase domain-containing protein [Thermoanaerobaculia bacterium]
MSRIPKLLAFLIVVLLAATTPASDDSTQLAERIDAYVDPFVEIGHLSGSLLLVQHGETVYAGSFGLADRELHVPITAATRSCIASITKPMTQIIALDLLENGLIGLDDPLSKWIADFPHGDEITLEMLAHHRAGIPHRLTDSDEEAVPRSAADMVELARRAQLDFPPGEKTSYSSGGYSVLARVLELATGKSYSDLLEEHVFAPAAMSDSVHPSGYEIIPNRASSYQFSDDGRLVNTPLKHYSFLVGAGSVFSTPRDLVRMMQSLVEGAYGELARQELLDDEGIQWAGRTNGYQAFADYELEIDT